MSEGNQNEPAAVTDAVREINRELFPFADELVGGERIKHPDDGNWGTYDDEQARIGLHFPGDERLIDPLAQSSMDLGVHVDALTDGDEGLYALGAAIYLDRVQPRDGGFTVWPGSHWMTAEHCELEPPNEDAEPGTRERARGPRIREGSEFDDIGELHELFCPFEITGDAGTVTLWHGNLIHSAGRQLAPGSVRMAAFSRFYLTPGNWAPGAIQEPFEHWAGLSGDEAGIDR